MNDILDFLNDKGTTTKENVITSNILDKEKEVESVDGIIKKDNYIFWYKVEIVKFYVYKYLKDKFSNSLLIDEFNAIDFLVVEELLPVEIQSTIYNKNDNALMHCGFENAIRRQLEDNIENYEKCWFFFDAEYYRYLSETEYMNISLNLDWFAKYVKDDKLKVFTVRYDGLIKELNYSDLEFIRKLSNTCRIEYEDDERILNRNKLKIFKNVLNGYKFTQDEINTSKELFNAREKVVKNGRINEKFTNFLVKKGDKRMKLYGYAWGSIQRLKIINELLDMKSMDVHAMFDSYYIGIFDNVGVDKKKFVDRFCICQYFPGYLRHQETWNRIKEGTFSSHQLRELFFTFHDKQQTKLEF